MTKPKLALVPKDEDILDIPIIVRDIEGVDLDDFYSGYPRPERKPALSRRSLIAFVVWAVGSFCCFYQLVRFYYAWVQS